MCFEKLLYLIEKKIIKLDTVPQKKEPKTRLFKL